MKQTLFHCRRTIQVTAGTQKRERTVSNHAAFTFQNSQKNQMYLGPSRYIYIFRFLVAPYSHRDVDILYMMIHPVAMLGSVK